MDIKHIRIWTGQINGQRTQWSSDYSSILLQLNKCLAGWVYKGRLHGPDPGEELQSPGLLSAVSGLTWVSAPPHYLGNLPDKGEYFAKKYNKQMAFWAVKSMFLLRLRVSAFQCIVMCSSAKYSPCLPDHATRPRVLWRRLPPLVPHVEEVLSGVVQVRNVQIYLVVIQSNAEIHQRHWWTSAPGRRSCAQCECRWWPWCCSSAGGRRRRWSCWGSRHS